MRTTTQEPSASELAASQFNLNQDLILFVLSLTDFWTVATSSCVCKSWKASIEAASEHFWRTVWHKSNSAEEAYLAMFDTGHMRGMDWPLLAAPVPCGILCGPPTAEHLQLSSDCRIAEVVLDKVPNLQGFGKDVSFLRTLAPIIDTPMFSPLFWPDELQAAYPFVLHWDTQLGKLTPDSLTHQLGLMHTRTGDTFRYCGSKLSIHRSKLKQLAYECLDEPNRTVRYSPTAVMIKGSGLSNRCAMRKQVSEWADNFDLGESHTLLADVCSDYQPLSEDEAVILAQNCMVAVHKLLRYVKSRTLIRIDMKSPQPRRFADGTRMVVLAGMSRSGYCVGLVVGTPVFEGSEFNNSDSYSEGSDGDSEVSDGQAGDPGGQSEDSD